MIETIARDSAKAALPDGFAPSARHRQLPLVVEVKRHSLEDGPGIRSVAFFKGCPLRCSFCQNPETQQPEAEIAFSPRKCIACGRCRQACPSGAVSLDAAGRILRGACKACGRCAEVCPGGGLRRIGTYYSPAALAEILLRDLPYYKHSGGGVTLSGGECTLYPRYVESLLRLLKAGGVHVALQTCGHFHFESFRRRLLPHLDLIYFDLKLADPLAHRRATGRPNHRILANLHRLLSCGDVEVQPRVPLVPGVTTTEKNLAAIVDLLCEAGARSITLLPYNPVGLDMYETLGRPRPRVPDRFMRPDRLRRLRLMFQRILARKAVSPQEIGAT